MNNYPVIPKNELRLGVMGRGDLDWAARVARFQRPACAETLPQQIARISSVKNLRPVAVASPAQVVEQVILPCKTASYHEPEMGEGRIAEIADRRIETADFINSILFANRA